MNKQTKIQQRQAMHKVETPYLECPPFPKQVLIEVSNVCNHNCSFCAYSLMTRPHSMMDKEFFKRIMQDAFDLGSREVGLHSGAEPFACKHLVEFISVCKVIGYEYIYITTNGSIPTEKKLKAAIDAGLDSIKFSVNAGDAETYEKIHGKPHFERVLKNIKFVSEYRKTQNKEVYLGASFIEVPENAATFCAMKTLIEPLVDEVIHLPADNQSGQMSGGYSTVLPEICSIPFKQLNITVEGYLRACCNDYQNMLVLEDLNKGSLKDAWQNAYIRDLRNGHLSGKLEGTLCHDCVNGCRTEVKPLRPDLADWGQV